MLIPHEIREVISTDRFASTSGGTSGGISKVFNHTFIVSHHLNTMLILFTFGVFAPILALEISIALYISVHINQLVLGRRLVIEAGIATIYERRIQNTEKYTVTHSQGTFIRLKPGASR